MSFIKSMILESKAYHSLENLGDLIEQGQSLENLPLQPLYMTLKSLPVEEAGNYLVHLSGEQRKLMLDIDLWQKDNIDVNEFEFWLTTYASSADLEIRDEFASSEEFALYLKSRFNIWTFDIEDPEYPDHDNYFLTDDSLLLFEFDEKYPYVNEVKAIIQNLYSSMGVEKAYAHLFKYVSEGYMSILEEEYRFKKGRLVDAGFVDYYDSLEMVAPFSKSELVDHFIKTKTKVTGNIDTFSKLQVLDQRSLTVFEQKDDVIDHELSLLGDPVREQYLRFNFIRLMNGTLTLANAFKEGSVVCNRVGQYVWDCLNLAMNYCQDYRGEKGLFEKFDFVDLYRIGNSLVTINNRSLIKKLKNNDLHIQDGFLGQFFERFLTGLDADRPYLEINDNKQNLDEKDAFKKMKIWSDCLGEMAPFVNKLKKTFEELKASGQLNDNFYLNYNIDQIDLEALMLSSMAKTYLNISGDQLKLGLTLDEFKQFTKMIIDEKTSTLICNDQFKSRLESFISLYGLSDIPNIDQYFINITKLSLEGVDYSSLIDEDYEHIGGPIILVS